MVVEMKESRTRLDSDVFVSPALYFIDAPNKRLFGTEETGLTWLFGASTTNIVGNTC